MFCKQCGKPIDDGEELCEECKVGQSQAAETAEPVQESQPINNGQNYNANANYNAGPQTNNQQAKSKMAAGLLGIFLGSLGVHNFYLGYTGKAIAQLLMTVLSPLTCGITAIGAGIWGLIEGILILTGSINTDASGAPLKD